MIGRELDTSHSLVEWLLRNRGGHVRGFVNAIFSGFSAIALARSVATIIKDHPELVGLFHLSSEPISKFDLLTLINRHFDAGIPISPDPSMTVNRSLDSARFRHMTGFKPPSWRKLSSKWLSTPTRYDLL